MSVYQTEEEQLQAIKKWWHRYSTPILFLFSVCLLAVSGVRYWNWYQEKQLTQASLQFERLIAAYSDNDEKQIMAFSNSIINGYNKSVYADVAHLIMAKLHATKGEPVEAMQQLDDVVKHSQVNSFKQIAKIRLARLALSQKQFDSALAYVEAIDDKAYETMVYELRGDIYSAKGQYAKALGAYRVAVAKAKEQGLGNLFLEMKTSDLVGAQHTALASVATVKSA